MLHPLATPLPAAARLSLRVVVPASRASKYAVTRVSASSQAWVFVWRLGEPQMYQDLFERAPWPQPENFFVRIIEWGYIYVKGEPRPDDVVFYGRGPDVLHVGLALSATEVESRFGLVIAHNVDNVPSRYGDARLVMRRISKRTPHRCFKT